MGAWRSVFKTKLPMNRAGGLVHLSGQGLMQGQCCFLFLDEPKFVLGMFGRTPRVSRVITPKPPKTAQKIIALHTLGVQVEL